MPIRKSSVSGGSTPSGTTADRPANPSIGDTFFNGTLGVQEIYTDSGWLPATGANDFNIVLTGSETAVTLDKEYFSGAYTIASSLSDTSLDIYLYNTSNQAAGYTNTPSINATDNFNKIIVYGGGVGDLLSFSYKTTFTTSTSTTDIYAAPYIVSIDNADLPNIDDTVTIIGGNFDTDIEVWFEGQNSYSQQAKSVIYGSSTSLVATRPDNLVEDNAPYTIRVVNPNTTSPTGSNKHKLFDSVTAGGDPTWSTTAGDLPIYDIGQPYSTTVLASDPDGSQITYSVASGVLPGGLSLNSSTGEISGTPTEVGSVVIAATDPSGNVTNRSFNFIANFNVAGGTYVESAGYAYHTFTTSGTLTVVGSGTVDALLVAGGGAGGTGWYSGGGGAGGIVYKTQVSIENNQYAIEVGDGGVQSTTTQVSGGDGGNSSAFGYIALGGGGGASRGLGDGNPGGSGGGFGRNGAGPTGQGGAGLQPSSASGGYGNKGGDGGYGGGGGGAGTAGTNAGSTPPYGAPGGDGLGTWSAWASATSTGDNGAYGGGGGGGRSVTPVASGGPGGGGNGAAPGTVAESGMPNTGGGGGGGTELEQPASGQTIGTVPVGGAGGSGVVIIRYPI